MGTSYKPADYRQCRAVYAEISYSRRQNPTGCRWKRTYGYRYWVSYSHASADADDTVGGGEAPVEEPILEAVTGTVSPVTDPVFDLLPVANELHNGMVPAHPFDGTEMTAAEALESQGTDVGAQWQRGDTWVKVSGLWDVWWAQMDVAWFWDWGKAVYVYPNCGKYGAIVYSIKVTKCEVWNQGGANWGYAEAIENFEVSAIYQGSPLTAGRGDAAASQQQRWLGSASVVVI